jgi:hypothetical protein
LGGEVIDRSAGDYSADDRGSPDDLMALPRQHRDDLICADADHRPYPL